MAVPECLSERGAALWEALGRELDSSAGAIALEACRTVDRLDRLDRMLTRAEAWFDLVEQPEGSGRLVVFVDKALAESRQQQLALKQLLTALGVDRAAGAPAEGGTPLARILSLVSDASGGSE